jgi:hypothetical protein
MPFAPTDGVLLQGRLSLNHSRYRASRVACSKKPEREIVTLKRSQTINTILVAIANSPGKIPLSLLLGKCGIALSLAVRSLAIYLYLSQRMTNAPCPKTKNYPIISIG